jgi:hypothetical protein
MLGLAACTVAPVTDSWVDPGTRSLPKFRKLVAALPSSDPDLRRQAEDAMVANLGWARAVPSYQIVPDWDGGSLDAIRLQLRQAGADGVIVVRFEGMQDEETWKSGARGFAPATETVVRMGITLTRVADGKTLYTAQTRTLKTGVDETVAEIVDGVTTDLKRRGLVR